MLVRLSGRALTPLGETSPQSFIGRISTDPVLADDQRGSAILRLSGDAGPLPLGFRAYFLDDRQPISVRDTYALASDWRYLAAGDIVRVDPIRHRIAVLYRRSSLSNFFLVTERCDNYCVMCSQPPKDHDDSWLVDELLEVIPLVSPETREIGLTGGEPALLGERLVAVLDALKTRLPTTAVHILSNGRRFANVDFARAVARAQHPDLMIGIPVYGDLPEDHDYVVQAKGAFDETIQGILNLKRAGVAVEIRFVIHAETYSRLPAFAEFLSRNLRFVDHVALMGLELMGFARTNLDQLWIDPVDYQSELAEATRILKRSGMRISIYNHQLCVLPESVRAFARPSISDWKNVYFEECRDCAAQRTCGGFFASSALRRSRGITPLSH